MFSGMWDSVFTKKRLVDTSGKLFSDRDDHPEGFVVDPKPLPEETVTEKHANYKHMFNRSYIEAATIGAGSIAAIAMILKYRKN
jgi:hypothetical protein